MEKQPAYNTIPSTFTIEVISEGTGDWVFNVVGWEYMDHTTRCQIVALLAPSEDRTLH